MNRRTKRRNVPRVAQATRCLGGTAARGLPIAWLLLTIFALPASAQDEAELGPGVGLTVYNQNFAVVKERRMMELPRGIGEVKFADVAATIVPETVQFSSLRPGAEARVLEQNYQFDLVNADALLDKYIDRRIDIVDRDGRVIGGTLLASAANELILNTADGIELVPRGRNIKDVRFASLPEGLLVRPTLVWKVDSSHAGEHLVKVAYRANNITWRVDYRAVASADEKRVDLAGWVTVTNRSGTTYRDAGLKLMAGDVHLVEEKVSTFGVPVKRGGGFGGGKEAAGFEEKAFAEYHLYTLGRKTTLADSQTKQIELIKVSGIPVTKTYRYQAGYGNRVAVQLEFENSDETHPELGIPLPKGPVRAYLRDEAGEVEFIGQDEIDHTPKDEPLRVRIGYAFDLVAERTQTANRQRRGQRWNEQDWRIRLRNHKAEPVTVLVREQLQPRRNWRILRRSQEFEQIDFQTIEFNVQLPPDSERVVTYTVEYTW